ncbi:MAG: hypothetical protein SP1CHLAM54_14150 [Chlamydiia bacterium]|nr:hypothetical protein [Chlamydiia bacterium]MCH9616307.1 hypothetical protein [Chlamydiia bacterium]MCH9629707.1 hypothetical protein [Chlamydiia bacterium]
MSGISGLGNVQMPSDGAGKLPPDWQTLKNDTTEFKSFIAHESSPDVAYSNYNTIEELQGDLSTKVGKILGDIQNILNSKSPLPGGIALNLQNSYKYLNDAYFGTNGYDGIQHTLIELENNTDDNPTDQCDAITQALTGPSMTNALDDIMKDIATMGG